MDLKLGRNDFDGAVDLAREAIKISPTSAGNHYRLAQIYVRQWRLRDAAKELMQSIALDSQAARLYRSLASVERCQGSLNDAIANQEKAVEFSQDKPLDLVELSAMNLAAGNHDRAVGNLQEALKLDPDNQTVHEKLVALLSQLKRFDELVAEYKRVCAGKSKDAGQYLGLGTALNEARQAR